MIYAASSGSYPEYAQNDKEIDHIHGLLTQMILAFWSFSPNNNPFHSQVVTLCPFYQIYNSDVLLIECLLVFNP